jgi:ABC-type transporter MlaC component
MPVSPSAMSLHLCYRLWIAELNFDINVLRIFGDYLAELRTKRKEQEVKAKSDYFEKQFLALRTEIDELRHEMHIGKMKLGAYARDAKPFDYKLFNTENQAPLKKRLTVYKSAFKKIEKEFEEFEARWLS